MAEADELMQLVHSDAIEMMEEEHRLQFEKHVQNLNTIKSKVQTTSGEKGTSGIGDGAEGMHEAIQDIVQAMHQLKTRLF